MNILRKIWLKIIISLIIIFWTFSSIANPCEDPFFSEEPDSKEPHKEQLNEKQALDDSIKTHSGLIAYIKFAQDVSNIPGMIESYERYREQLNKNKISTNPEDYQFIEIEGNNWFINKHNSSPKDINIVRNVLAEKKDIAESIWRSFGGSIDRFLAVRKEVDFTEFGEQKSPVQLMGEHLSPQIIRTVIYMAYPVLTRRELDQLRYPISIKKQPKAFPISTQLTQQTYTKIIDKIQKSRKTTNQFTNKHTNHEIKQELMKKIIRIVHASDPNF